MRFMKKGFNFFCEVLTRYFLLWSPQGETKDCRCQDCSENEFKQYIEYYGEATRWSF